jgi:hypothetical protein
MPRGKKKKKGPSASHAGSNGSGLVAGMQAYHAQLASECNRLQSAMSALETAMSAMGVGPVARASAPAKRGPGRPAGSGSSAAARPGPRPEGKSLKDYIGKALSGGGVLSVKEITHKVQQAGYPTRSSNLANQISMALSQMQKAKKLRKVGRGQYTA